MTMSIGNLICICVSCALLGYFVCAYRARDAIDDVVKCADDLSVCLAGLQAENKLLRTELIELDNEKDVEYHKGCVVDKPTAEELEEDVRLRMN